MKSDKMVLMYNDLERAATAYAEAYNAHNKGKKALKPLKDEVKRQLDMYNASLAIETFKAWGREGDPVKTAIRVRNIPHALRVSFKTNDDTDFMTITISEDPKYRASLPVLAYTLGDDVFADPDWNTKVKTLADIAIGVLNTETAENPTYKYNPEAAAEVFDFAGTSPYTAEGMSMALQQTIDSILFIDDGNGKNVIDVGFGTHADGTVYSRFWSSLHANMTRAGKDDGETVVTNTGNFTSLLAGLMHIGLTHGDLKVTREEEPKFDIPPATED